MAVTTTPLRPGRRTSTDCAPNVPVPLPTRANRASVHIPVNRATNGVAGCR